MSYEYLPVWKEIVKNIDKPEYAELLKHSRFLESQLTAALKVVEKMKHHKDTWHDPGIGCLAECRYVCEALDEYNKTCGDK